MRGVQIDVLTPSQLFSVCSTLWLEWHLVEDDFAKGRAKMLGALASVDRGADEVLLPDGGVMREGPLGVNAR